VFFGCGAAVVGSMPAAPSDPRINEDIGQIASAPLPAELPNFPCASV
jgi:hypothetical protein